MTIDKVVVEPPHDFLLLCTSLELVNVHSVLKDIATRPRNISLIEVVARSCEAKLQESTEIVSPHFARGETCHQRWHIVLCSAFVLAVFAVVLLQLLVTEGIQVDRSLVPAKLRRVLRSLVINLK